MPDREEKAESLDDYFESRLGQTVTSSQKLIQQGAGYLESVEPLALANQTMRIHKILGEIARERSVEIAREACLYLVKREMSSVMQENESFRIMRINQVLRFYGNLKTGTYGNYKSSLELGHEMLGAYHSYLADNPLANSERSGSVARHALLGWMWRVSPWGGLGSLREAYYDIVRPDN